MVGRVGRSGFGAGVQGGGSVHLALDIWGLDIWCKGVDRACGKDIGPINGSPHFGAGRAGLVLTFERLCPSGDWWLSMLPTLSVHNRPKAVLGHLCCLFLGGSLLIVSLSLWTFLCLPLT